MGKVLVHRLRELQFRKEFQCIPILRLTLGDSIIENRSPNHPWITVADAAVHPYHRPSMCRGRAGIFAFLCRKSMSACFTLIQDLPHVASSTAFRFRVAVWSGSSHGAIKP
jgi:hypothetical protein